MRYIPNMRMVLPGGKKVKVRSRSGFGAFEVAGFYRARYPNVDPRVWGKLFSLDKLCFYCSKCNKKVETNIPVLLGAIVGLIALCHGCPVGYDPTSTRYVSREELEEAGKILGLNLLPGGED